MRWTIKPKPTVSSVAELSESLKVDPLVAELLLQRGISTYNEAHEFFRPNANYLHDPFLMKDMQAAVDRIQHAIAQNENILVYGDYDVDGTTSVAMMSSYLKSKYPNVATYIPDRYEEGYGVSYQGIDFAEDNGFSLIVALDCGIKAIDKVAYAKEKGIDFIICDHHLPGPELPAAVAVLDPKRPDCNYPYKELCGCGVGFKLIQALGTVYEENLEDLSSYLDLVATAIAADIVPITGENRILSFLGLQVINKSPRPGIAAMTLPLSKNELTVSDVVFIIAPRINAAGRMKHGNHAVTLLTETDLALASQWASEVETFNQDRKEADYQITNEALDQIKVSKKESRSTTVVYHPEWHKGVIGIVASRLTETYYRPTVVLTRSGEGKLAGSVRSVKGFDVYAALEASSEHLIQFGGHKYAAGLTLNEKDLEQFEAQFEAVVKATIDSKMLVPELVLDREIAFNQINDKLYRIIRQFAPFGPGNRTPMFMSTNVFDTGQSKRVGSDKNHLKVVLQQTDSPPVHGIAFGLGDQLDEIQQGRPFSIAYTIEENTWQGMRSLQLRIKDIKV